VCVCLYGVCAQACGYPQRGGRYQIPGAGVTSIYQPPDLSARNINSGPQKSRTHASTSEQSL
jgi:hypothetical protein